MYPIILPLFQQENIKARGYGAAAVKLEIRAFLLIGATNLSSENIKSDFKKIGKRDEGCFLYIDCLHNMIT